MRKRDPSLLRKCARTGRPLASGYQPVVFRLTGLVSTRERIERISPEDGPEARKDLQRVMARINEVSAVWTKGILMSRVYPTFVGADSLQAPLYLALEWISSRVSHVGWAPTVTSTESITCRLWRPMDTSVVGSRKE